MSSPSTCEFDYIVIRVSIIKLASDMAFKGFFDADLSEYFIFGYFPFILILTIF